MEQPFSAFSDLRVHSHYSYRDGVCSVAELAHRAAELGRPALALTDHNHAAGFIELQEAADKYSLKPIFGVDATVADENEQFYKLVLLAKNASGLQNLFRLLTWAGTEGFDLYGQDKPVLAESKLLESTLGLAVIGSDFPDGKGEQRAYRLHEACGADFYVELLSHQSANVERVRLAEFAKQHNLPIVATSGVHYISPEQANTRDLLWAIADNVRFDAPNRRRPASSEAYPRTLAELAEIYATIPEALHNAATLAASCEVRLPKSGLIIPDYVLPPTFQPDTGATFSAVGQYLAQVAAANLQARYGEIPTNMQERLDYEIGVIEKAGFNQYILIVADIVQRAHELGILCAPRGSSAGSLVCFALGITPLNPLDFNLVFERFLNPERLSPPDIDLDIADEDRPRLLDYVVRKYGVNNVAHIITHNFEGAKSALRDAGKALNIDSGLVNRLSGLVPLEFQRPYTLARTLEEVKEVQQLYKRDKAAKELIDAALLLEGTGRNNGTHAAGVVITPRPTQEYVPLIRTEGLAQQQRDTAQPDTETSGWFTPTVMTQWDMQGVEKRGLLKIDLLGLTAWSTITRTLDFIRQERDIALDVWQLPLDDEKTYDTIGQGYTTGVFQLENRGMTDFAANMKPRNVADLGFLIAAYRPGPMPFLGKIMAVRSGREKLEAPHPSLEPLLAESYGAPVYQETMLRIAVEVAGYSLGEADALRKAISKKNQIELEAQHIRFVEGARKTKELSEAEAEAIWQFFPPFAFYGFNQAHAIIYGYLTYITAYLKTNYPLEYMAALLGAAGGDLAALGKAATECRRLNVPLLAPNINRSMARITLENLPAGQRALRLGLSAVKGLGPTGVEAIIALRNESGDYTGLVDFVRRAPGRSVNSRALVALARVGALPFGNRAQLETAIPAAQKAAKAKEFHEIVLPALPEYPDETVQAYENELLGFALTLKENGLAPEGGSDGVA
jgi:DNA polymerase-3 subunit alpha